MSEKGERRERKKNGGRERIEGVYGYNPTWKCISWERLELPGGMPETGWSAGAIMMDFIPGT